ncbi:translocation/assembly module TamB domain-containing protein [Methylocella sp.]|uniref:translocation/assembly module TamB domain-containing protein n=1 Tax=Methylocella sp. TaxID=1978226 RepID=UPI0035AFF19A
MARRRIISLSALAAMLALAIVGAGLVAFAVGGRAADEQKGVLADLISRALSTPESRVSIGAIEGALSSDATIRNLQIADRDGVWLSINKARIVWRRLALLQRRLEVDQLDVDEVKMPRRPIPAETPVSGEDQPLLPELPLRVDIRQFTLARADLSKPVFGVESAFSTGGYAKLGPPAEGLQFFLDAQRLDKPATVNVRLNLVPGTQRLDLKVNLDEPAGGIISELANIPNRPPVRLNIDGAGALDAFNAKLLFDAGPGVGAKGDAALNREGAGRRFGFDLAAEVSGMLPDVAAPVFAGTTRLSGNVAFNDDSSVDIPGVALTAAAARLVVKGAVSKDRQADITIMAENVANDGAGTKLKDLEIGRLALNAAVRGALDQPTVDSTLEAERARLPAAAFDRLEASFKAAPSGPIGEASTVLNLSADAALKGLALANPSLARAVGSQASLTLRGRANIRGGTDLDALDLKSESLSAGFKGRLAKSELRGRLEAAFPDLSRFSGLANLTLAGAAKLKADVEGTPRSNRYSANLDARAERFATGLSAVDGLFGGTLTLAGAARLDPDGGFGFKDLRLNGPNASARVDGAATPALADLTAQILAPDLSKADARAKGAAEISAHLTGTLDKPDADATIAIRDASLIGRPVPRLEVKAQAKDLRGDLDARLSLDGEIDRKPARGGLRLSRPAAGGYALSDLDLSIGSASARGALSLDADNFAAGQLSVSAPNLDDLSALALRKLSGALDVEAAFSHEGGRQDASLKGSGRDVSAFDVSLSRFSADLSASDLYRSPRVSGSAAIDEARVAGQTVSRVRLDARPSGDASDVTLSALASGFSLDARARVLAQTPVRIDLARFDVSRGRERIALAGPASVTIADGGAAFRNLAFNLGGGRLSIDGRAGETLDLKVAARRIPLSVAEIASPGLGLSGTLDGEANVSGPAGAPTGAYKLSIAGLTAPQTKSAGLPPIAVSASGRFENGRVTTDATIAAPPAGRFTIKGSAPMSAEGALDLAVKGALDAGIANRSMSAAGRNVKGSVAIDGRVGGTLAKPQVFGSASLAGGSFRDVDQGVRLDAINAKVVAKGDMLTIERASASTPNGGTLSASGSVRVDPAAGFPGDIRLSGRNAQLVQSAIATGVANLDMTLSGPLAKNPRVGGKVDILSLDIQIPDRLPASLRPLPGRHIAPTPTAAARLALDARARRAGAAFDAALDLAINAPGHIRVRGRGLDATLGGGLKLTGTLQNPKPVGAFSLVTGRLRILTSDLDFTRANLTFSGDLNPELDFLASTQAGGASINVGVSGPPSDPAFSFTSSPDLPQDEVMSRLLFGTSSGQLSPTQALMLAQAVAIYTGGNDALEELRRSLGLGAGDSSNPLSNFLGDRVNVGIQSGATPQQTGVGVTFDIWRAVKARGVIDATGAVSVGVGAEHEW